MKVFLSFQSGAFFDALVSLAAAFLMAFIIGAERQYRNRSAGLRTNVLVAIGSAAFVHMGSRLNHAVGAAQIASYVVSGIGFLGAGAILRDGANVKGINTAATLWTAAAVGALSGASLIAEAFALTLFVLAGNTLLRPVVNAINRLPFNERTGEARYQVHVTAEAADGDHLRDFIANTLKSAHYPARSIAIYRRDDRYVEVVATLLVSAVNAKELDALTDAISANKKVVYATWTQRSMD